MPLGPETEEESNTVTQTIETINEEWNLRSSSPWTCTDQMTSATRNQVLSLYMRVFRIARGWQSTLPQETESERRYIVQEAQTLFRQNQQLTDHTAIKNCIDECEARIGIGLHYRNPYPRPLYLPVMGLATQKGRKLKAQQRMRKQAKPVYLQSHDEDN
ncbi:unnamed protein product [Oncorhynchus mykiss]|uniref:Complex 1 LYR protein domain-containing protein n=1 Tax=Oncorhynchus mykiss TaxID=8022 RepID=A0A060WUL2_ONCMY|nr:unnamed protein product [Oncorhynchus mykiss]